MNSKIIDGKTLALKHEVVLREKIQKLNVKPKIVSILVGNDPASVLYSRMKKNKAEEVGIGFELREFQRNPDLSILKEEIEKLNNDPGVMGIMIQLPLPKDQYDDNQTDKVIGLIDPKKDVDGLTGKGLVPQATTRGVLSIFDAEGIDISGKKVGIVGITGIVGRSLAERLKNKGATILGFNSKTASLNQEASQVDILISCVGKFHLIGPEAVKAGAVVIDGGGDVDFDAVYPKISKITPPKGGVGPMTVISLMENAADLVSATSADQPCQQLQRGR